MQINEIQLLNQPVSVYAKNFNNYELNNRVVVKYNDCLEIGVLKGSTKEEINAEIIRLATSEDNKIHCENCKFSKSILADIKKEAQKLNLDMKIGFISTSLDKSKLIINYTSDERVDFRELIKILASTYKTKIEMRQIGNRDETKQVGALGVCGRVTCCKAFLNDFDKVRINMAKTQNISLNPTRINGMCGRLLCCLKYEDEFYEEMQQKMPKEHSFVTTPDGKGEVVSRDFLRETVTVAFKKEEDIVETKIYSLEEISKNNK